MTDESRVMDTGRWIPFKIPSVKVNRPLKEGQRCLRRRNLGVSNRCSIRPNYRYLVSTALVSTAQPPSNVITARDGASYCCLMW